MVGGAGPHSTSYFSHTSHALTLVMKGAVGALWRTLSTEGCEALSHSERQVKAGKCISLSASPDKRFPGEAEGGRGLNLYDGDDDGG